MILKNSCHELHEFPQIKLSVNRIKISEISVIRGEQNHFNL